MMSSDPSDTKEELKTEDVKLIKKRRRSRIPITHLAYSFITSWLTPFKHIQRLEATILLRTHPHLRDPHLRLILLVLGLLADFWFLGIWHHFLRIILASTSVHSRVSCIERQTKTRAAPRTARLDNGA